MYGMFNEAEAFNQPLSFDIGLVTDVRDYICLESDRNEKPNSELSFPTQLIR